MGQNPPWTFYVIDDTVTEYTINDINHIKPTIIYETVIEKEIKKVAWEGVLAAEFGDGDTINDCVISPDKQSFCVRAERQGTKPEGRHYGVGLVAVDACGNKSDEAVVGYIYVPHDQSPAEKDCINTTKVGLKDLDEKTKK